MKRARTWFTCLLIGISVACAQADPVDDFVAKQMGQKGIPGVSLAVVHSGKVAKLKGYGKASLEWDIPVTEDTVFEIGSITKQFTGTLIAMLAEEKKMGLDDKISGYFSNAPAFWSNVTIRHLLTHTSGIRNYTGLTGYEASKRLTAAQFVEEIGKHPLQSEPGEKFAYCNSGYNLLGYIIEKVSGKTYWQVLQERIFGPLEMKASQSRDLEKIIPRRAYGYERKNNQFINRDSDLTDVFSAGAIVSTVPDLLKWQMALEGGKLVKKTTLEQMWSPYQLNNGQSYTYGFGWRLDNYKGTRCIGHSGSTSGFSSSLQQYPDLKLTVVVLTNSGEQGVGTQLARGIADLYLSPEKPMAKN